MSPSMRLLKQMDEEDGFGQEGIPLKRTDSLRLSSKLWFHDSHSSLFTKRNCPLPTHYTLSKTSGFYSVREYKSRRFRRSSNDKDETSFFILNAPPVVVAYE
ncbi:unnamed protein product [Ilex paraguariensis]|uniref:Uncharacterized protein n=2 Tax=Ilex paraguariensis TaxID=185542 RepID=A0ABC8RS36_9AQUA